MISTYLTYNYVAGRSDAKRPSEIAGEAARGGAGDEPRPPGSTTGSGADYIQLSTDRFDTGASPLVRGGRLELDAWTAPVGRIPTGAGRTLQDEPRPAATRTHPRWCGADLTLPIRAAEWEGASPLVRGGRRRARVCSPARGRIPAGAGRTNRLVFEASMRLGASPLVRGGHPPAPQPSCCHWGASPLVRGGQRSFSRQVRRQGRIPAGAGRTSGCGSAASSWWAHPRWCGADLTGRSRRVPSRGRIPAGAGRTSTPPSLRLG